jgi:hypothetical protein
MPNNSSIDIGMFQAQTTLIFFSLYMLCISSNQLRIRACGLTITFPQNQNNRYCVRVVIFVPKFTPYTEPACYLCSTDFMGSFFFGQGCVVYLLLRHRQCWVGGKVLSHKMTRAKNSNIGNTHFDVGPATLHVLPAEKTC